MIRVVLPSPLRALARVNGELRLDVAGTPTIASVLDAIEAGYPALKGTIRDYQTRKRRDFVRFYACERDLSHQSPEFPLPDPVAAGTEPLLIVGAISGG